VYKVAERIGMTTAGGVGDAQQLARILTVECNLYQIRRSRSITVGASATLLSNHLNQNRHFPYYVQLLIGGVDEKGPSVYSVDAMGGATREEEIVATGSGSPMAYGVLEDRFHKDMTEDEAIDIAIRALKSAMKRDAGSGEGIHVVVITKDKYLEMGEDALQKYLVKSPA
jgi:proteasome beta subunit